MSVSFHGPDGGGEAPEGKAPCVPGSFPWAKRMTTCRESSGGMAVRVSRRGGPAPGRLRVPAASSESSSSPLAFGVESAAY